jgi:NADH:ubiquinone oxidoreductase subunit E
MVFLKEVEIKGNKYYYLYHIITKPNFRKYRKFLGKNRPTNIKETEKKFLEEIRDHPEKFEKDDKNTIEILQKIQEKEKYISEENIIKLSKELTIPAMELYGLITFYSQFKINPPGKYRISICRGTACHVKNSDELLLFIEEYLKIKSGETTDDSKFSLECVNCIGACAKAPAIMINEKVYGELTNNKLKKILNDLQ